MYSDSFPEQLIYHTLIDLKELIEKYGVKVIVEEMDEGTIHSLNEGIKSYFIKKANKKLNG